jgi:hypothetical protein
MKRGLIGIIILSILGVLVLGILGGAYYAYNVHVYKTVRVCLAEEWDSKFPCENTQQCIELIEQYSNSSQEIKARLEGAPQFLKEKIQEAIDKGVRCDTTCIVRDLRGINKETGEFEFLESCNPGEEEIALDIRGKEALEIKKFLDENSK